MGEAHPWPVLGGVRRDSRLCRFGDQPGMDLFHCQRWRLRRAPLVAAGYARRRGTRRLREKVRCKCLSLLRSSILFDWRQL